MTDLDRVTLRLSEELLEDLDEVADRRHGGNRSAAVRSALETLLAGEAIADGGETPDGVMRKQLEDAGYDVTRPGEDDEWRAGARPAGPGSGRRCGTAGGAPHGGAMMEQPNADDDRSTDTDHAADSEAVDTDVEALIDEIRAGNPGEHTTMTVGLTGYTVERIDLERDHKGGEGIQDWIRHAIDDYLAGEGVDVATTDGFEGPRVDVEHNDDTPLEEIFQRLDDVERRDRAPVAIELPSAAVAAIHGLESRREETVASWIRTAIWRRFNYIDHDLELHPTLEVEVPPQVAVRARLRAEHRAHRRGADYDDALLDSLNELVEVQPEFVLEGGDVLATFADDGGDR